MGFVAWEVTISLLFKYEVKIFILCFRKFWRSTRWARSTISLSEFS